MRRTISIKLATISSQHAALLHLRELFNRACNDVASVAQQQRCWGRVALHHLCYYQIRDKYPTLGAQMVCNAIRTVCDAYKVLQLRKSDTVPTITFKSKSSVHFDKRTYSFRGDLHSLNTVSGRILVRMDQGDFQRVYLKRGSPKEAELICKNGAWFFNLVLDLPDTPVRPAKGKVLGVDAGENNLAAISTGKLFGGGKLRHERDRSLALQGRLQSNGTESSKQLLAKISGKAARHVRHVNHVISKAIVDAAIASECDTIAMETLTNLCKRIRAGKRMRSRLHLWAWAQLQRFIQYKAEAAGLRVVFVNPAYTSQMCANCKHLGIRHKHRFVCKFCGIQRHSDLNASQNIRGIAVSADAVTGTVNCPNVATV